MEKMLKYSSIAFFGALLSDCYPQLDFFMRNGHRGIWDDHTVLGRGCATEPFYVSANDLISPGPSPGPQYQRHPNIKDTPKVAQPMMQK